MTDHVSKDNRQAHGTYKYIDIITALFATLLIVSNFASTRIIDFAWGMEFDAGTLMFPMTYIFNDLLTEVYGYSRSRRVIWIGFSALAISALSMALVGLFPASAGWGADEAWKTIMGMTPRIVTASLAAYFVGEFVNSYVLAKMKVKMEGRFLPIRLIGSTMAGQVFDTLIFALVAFAGVLPWGLWLVLVASNYIFKIFVEILLLPLTMFVVRHFKAVEGVDTYDRDTKFSPFSWKL